MKSLNSVRVVNCDEVQLRILGLSLAGWDVVASAVAAALRGARGEARALRRLTARLGLRVERGRSGAPAATRIFRYSSRFSWIEAITRPIGTPMSTSVASASCRLASIVSGTASVTPRS